jgi:hypothetical protein
MGTRADIISVAEHHVGYKESAGNKNIFGKWYGMDGLAWCAMFVSFVYDKAGLPLGKIDSPKGYHYCPSAYNFWRKKGLLTENPKAGDIVLFDFNKDKKMDHTGIFIGWVDDSRKEFYSIEGNTSAGVAGSQSNGDGVYKRKRAYSKAGVIFVNHLND